MAQLLNGEMARLKIVPDRIGSVAIDGAELVTEAKGVEVLTGPLQLLPFARRLVLTAAYLMRTDVHTFAFSVAANAILSFFPFMVLLMTLIRQVFRSQLMYDVVVNLLRDSLPAGQEFVIRNINALVGARHRVQ